MIHGPMRLAIGKGSFFQVLIIKEYFGLSGFLSGNFWPGRKWYSYSSHSGVKPQFFLKENAPVPALLRPKSNLRKPRAAARRMTSQYRKSLAPLRRASLVPPP